MKGDKGNCQIIVTGDLILKTKFDTEKNCQLRINTLNGLGVLDIDTVIYKCKECGFFHMGSSEQSKLYGKKIKNKKS